MSTRCFEVKVRMDVVKLLGCKSEARPMAQERTKMQRKGLQEKKRLESYEQEQDSMRSVNGWQMARSKV